jgi:hypothetical protein
VAKVVILLNNPDNKAPATPPTKVDTVKILNTANQLADMVNNHKGDMVNNHKEDMANNHKDTVKLLNMVNKINMLNRKVTDSNPNTDSLATMPPAALTLINNNLNMINTVNLNTVNPEIHKIVVWSAVQSLEV